MLTQLGRYVPDAVAVAIGGIDTTTGEHVHTASERSSVGATQHEHLERSRLVAQQHHRCGGLRGQNVVDHWANGIRWPSLHIVLVWMDLEMTGLDPAKNVIVEIATIVTDDQLNIVAEGPDLVIHQPEEALAMMEPVVVDMHTRSGLLDQIRASTFTLEEAGRITLEFIKEHVPSARSVPLCGNSIGMDRRFLDAYLPEIEHYLHYRSVDVSSVKELVRRWYPAVLNSRGNKQGTHRALDDVRESIAEMRFYREHVFVAGDTPSE